VADQFANTQLPLRDSGRLIAMLAARHQSNPDSFRSWLLCRGHPHLGRREN
jgi:hypothetical protein